MFYERHILPEGDGRGGTQKSQKSIFQPKEVPFKGQKKYISMVNCVFNTKSYVFRIPKKFLSTTNPLTKFHFDQIFRLRKADYSSLNNLI